MTSQALPRVFIVGGGFAGLAAAKSLAEAPVDPVVIDRRNHHVFQPLLYQVATASLAPTDICVSIRTVLRGQKNCRVVLAEITGVDVTRRRVMVRNGYVTYDYLTLAAGATPAYFGHDDWVPIAPGLKSIEDATELRRRILLAFESAEYEGSEEARRAALTFGIVGGGPTGVELAGAIKAIAGQTIPRDYRSIDTRTTRVILFEAGRRLLPPFPPARCPLPVPKSNGLSRPCTPHCRQALNEYGSRRADTERLDALGRTHNSCKRSEGYFPGLDCGAGKRTAQHHGVKSVRARVLKNISWIVVFLLATETAGIRQAS